MLRKSKEKAGRTELPPRPEYTAGDLLISVQLSVQPNLSPLLLGRRDRQREGFFPDIDVFMNVGHHPDVALEHATIDVPQRTITVLTEAPTFLNHERLTPGTPYALADADLLSLGEHVHLQIELVDPKNMGDKKARFALMKLTDSLTPEDIHHLRQEVFIPELDIWVPQWLVEQAEELMAAPLPIPLWKAVQYTLTDISAQRRASAPTTENRPSFMSNTRR